MATKHKGTLRSGKIFEVESAVKNKRLDPQHARQIFEGVNGEDIQILPKEGEADKKMIAISEARWANLKMEHTLEAYEEVLGHNRSWILLDAESVYRRAYGGKDPISWARENKVQGASSMPARGTMQSSKKEYRETKAFLGKWFGSKECSEYADAINAVRVLGMDDEETCVYLVNDPNVHLEKIKQAADAKNEMIGSDLHGTKVSEALTRILGSDIPLESINSAYTQGRIRSGAKVLE